MDSGLKILMLVAVIALVFVLTRGVPVQLSVNWPGAYPVSVSGNGERFELQMETDGTGVVVITRLDKYQGRIEVFELDRIGRKLNPVAEHN